MKCVAWLLLAARGETDKYGEKPEELKRIQIQSVLVLKSKAVLSPRVYRWQTMLRLRNNFQAHINLGHNQGKHDLTMKQMVELVRLSVKKWGRWKAMPQGIVQWEKKKSCARI